VCARERGVTAEDFHHTIGLNIILMDLWVGEGDFACNL